MTQIQLFSTFDSSIYVELAITKLETKGIKREAIYAIPLNNRTESPRLFDTIHRSDGTSLIDIGMTLATAFSVIGISIGFTLTWGPIIWGLISAFIGFVLGVGIRLYIEVVLKKRKIKQLKGKHAEIILIIDCTEEQVVFVEEILWEHFAFGIAKVE